MTPTPQHPRLPYIALRPELLDSIRESVSDAQLGLAVRLVKYCVTHGYTGRIPAARDWTARQWTFLVGVDTPPATDVAKLWHWETDTLVVDLYDHEYAEKVQARTAQSKAAAAARWNPPASPAACGSTATPHAPAPIYNNNPYTQPEKEKTNTLSGNNTVDYSAWRDTIAVCHPSAARRIAGSPLAPDVEEAAQWAYTSLDPAATLAAAPLLKAYFNSRLTEDKHGEKYIRPTSQRQYFLKLAENIYRAETWAKETKWKPTKNTTEHDTKPPQTKQTATPEDTAAFTSWLSADVDTHTAGRHPATPDNTGKTPIPPHQE